MWCRESVCGESVCGVESVWWCSESVCVVV